MEQVIYVGNDKYLEYNFKTEQEFELLIKENNKLFFGKSSIYFDIKNKIDSKTFGASIPNGFLFDFTDKENPEFYIVEVELEKHDFYRHIFPQITKFFAFFKNPASRNLLIEKIYNFIKSNNKIESEFKQYLGKQDIYKIIKETIENSQNILLIIDENKSEFQEIMETYTDTWDKIVRIQIIKKYNYNNNFLFLQSPSFEDINYIDPTTQKITQEYDEVYHTKNISKEMVSLYGTIKKEIIKIDSTIMFNSQKYYISVKQNKNFANIQLRNKKIQMVVMAPYEKGQNIIKKHDITQLSQSVQNFYGRPCFKINLTDQNNLDEVLLALKEAYDLQKKNK